jgi:predicted permease
MSEFLRDLRFGLRLLSKSPVFAITAALLLAIGISANTLIFSLINALLLRPLPVSHPENLVRLVEVHPNDFVTWDLPYSFCKIAASRDADLSEVICQGEADVAFSDGNATERVRVHLVSPKFFSSLGVQARLGRVLTAEDERTGPLNAVLSYSFWKRKFQGDVSVVGRKIILAGHAFTIVGVSPEEFNGLAVDTSPAVRVPTAADRLLIRIEPEARQPYGQVFARLRKGVPFELANADADPLLHAAYEEAEAEADAKQEGRDPKAKRTPQARSVIKSRLRLEPIENGVSTLRAQFSRSLEVLMAGVAMLLLMACANVAGLLLARSTARSQEMSVRLALGASPGRIVRQLLTEGLLLALLGGAGGILLTAALLPLLVRGLPPIRDRAAVLQPLAVHVSIDFRVLAFAVGAVVLTAILFALSPALRCARAEVAGTLRSARSTTPGLLPRSLFVMAQVAICTLILMGAALLVGTLDRMRSMNVGFDRDHIVSFTIDPGLVGRTPEQSRILSETLLDKAAALAGARAVGIANRAVMRGTGVKATFGVAGSLIGSGDFLNSSLNGVTPGYFATMGMRLLAGREFDWFDRDASGTPRKVIVNQTFARKFFPGLSPLGRRFGGAELNGIASHDFEIIGVVTDAKYRSLREPVPPTVYNPVVDGFDSAFTLYVRTEHAPQMMVAPVREVLHSLDPELPLIEVQTLRDEVEASLWQERLLALLSTIFGAIAALLASIGLYGALDYAVKSRTREIGVRMALGAQPQRIVGVFSREAFLLTASGLAVGLGAYAAAAAWIHRVLYDLRPWEPAAILWVVFLIGLIATVATAPAVYRALRIDPASALRVE